MSAGGGDGVAINQSSGGGLVRARAWLAAAAVPGTHTHNTQQRPVTTLTSPHLTSYSTYVPAGVHKATG